MKINQLFVKPIDHDILINILECFDLKGLNDMHMFSKKELEQRKTTDRLNMLKPQLSEYYLHCKAKVYLEDITVKKALTILKQVLRLYGHSLSSYEKNIQNKKITYYKMVSLETKNNTNLVSISNNENIILFN
jgi:hypothetical protein